MQKQLFEINKQNLSLVYEIVQSFRTQKFFTGTSSLSVLLRNMNKVAEFIFSQAECSELAEELQQILPALLDAQNNQDYILQADILEGDLLPLLQKIQMRLQNTGEALLDDYWDANMQILQQKNPALYEILMEEQENEDFFWNRYQMTVAINGQPTALVTRESQTFYMHSSVNPETEAKVFVSTWKEAAQYVVIGFGLGYHVFELLRKYPDCEVTVLESEIGLIRASIHYLNWAENLNMERLNIVYDPDMTKLLKELNHLQEDSELLIYYPTIQAVEDDKIRMLLEDFFMTTSSMREQSHFLDENFRKIQMRKLPECSALKAIFYHKNVVIAGAGPSITGELAAIRDHRKELTVFATGHIAGTLLKENIIPDAIIITDPQPHMYRQIMDLDTEEIPLILLSTASASVLDYYKGPIYIAYQNGYHPAEEAAQKLGTDTFDTGGSVTTTALDIALRFEADKIIFVGVDLAYTGGNSHAEGVGRKITNTNGLRKVISCTGEEIYTSRNLDIYRKWIERRIEKVTGTVIYNTGNGARIKGTRRMVW